MAPRRASRRGRERLSSKKAESVIAARRIEVPAQLILTQVIGDSSADASKLMKREGVRTVPSFHFWKSGARVDVVNGANIEAVTKNVQKYL